MAKGDCPYCRQPGAVRVLWKVRCPNGACPKYDPTLARTRMRTPVVAGAGDRPAGGAGMRPFLGLVLIISGIIVFLKIRGITGIFLGGWLAIKGWKMMNAGKVAGTTGESGDGPQAGDDEEPEDREEWAAGTLDGYSEKRDEPLLSGEDRLDRQDRDQEEMQSRQERKRDYNDRESRR